MLLKDLTTIYRANKNRNPLFVRNMLKEHIQYYILQFISQSKWSKSFIFKGGTCLRMCFDLPRLSEDLDFDILDIDSFNWPEFIKALQNYFIASIQYNSITTKLANNQRTLYVKFPLLRNIGIPLLPSESETVFVRIDISPVFGKAFTTELAIKTFSNFSLLIQRYSLADLFSGKIAAILTRETIEGFVKRERIKGRDYFDLIWFLEKRVSPNWRYFREITGLTKQQALLKLKEKVNKADASLLESDLTPFFEDNTFVQSFSKNIGSLYESYSKHIT